MGTLPNSTHLSNRAGTSSTSISHPVDPARLQYHPAALPPRAAEMLSSSESRRRKKDPDRDRNSPKKDKDRDRDRDKDKDKERERRKSSKSTRPSSRKTKSSTSSSLVKDDDDESEHPRERPVTKERSRTSSSKTPRSIRMAIVPEMDRRGSLGSPNGSRTSLGAYPTFSKTHSKDDPYSRSELAARNKSAFTPEPTDVSDRPAKEEKESVIHASPPAPTRAPPTPPPARAPPSPPLTATTANDLRKTASANSIRRAEALQKEMEAGRRSVDSGTRLTPEPRFAGARSSVHENATGMEGTELTSTTEGSEPSTVRGKSPARVVQSTVRLASPANAPSPARAASSNARPASRQASRVTQSTASDATSVAPTQQNARRHLAPSPSHSEASPASAMDSSPRTPTQHSVVYDQKAGSPMIEIMTDPISRAQSAYTDVTDVTDVTDTTDYTNDAPMTPPPPPPPPMMMEPPRVDYLLQNGGLSRPVPRSLLAAIDGGPIAAYNQYTSPRVSGAQEHDVRAFFTPLQKLLDDYTTVMDTNGSLAVATGYRSVARRLLDRLEAVFARNISSEFCHCIMCADNPVNQVNEDDAGVNWGEILELVSGRCDLPAWPPFDQSTSSGLGISDLEAPCQRIDVDVPEQYREHYQQQSRKTKVAVQSWLSNQHDVAPEDADEETLTFAMLTRLEQPKRPLFYALLYGLDELPNPRTKPDTSASTPPLISKAAVALQRLYRLYSPPRNQLVVMYLIRNPDKHNILATLSAVTKQEWEILVSGRFDGFLWSGAEDHNGISSPPPGGFSRGPSRGPSGQMFPDGGFQRFATPTVPGQHTPFSTGPSPGPGMRPGSVRPPGPAPVQIDEDTEIAVLAEIEREIFLGMEAMEDAFEHLHNSAEVIRRRLRERGAALAMVAQARRGPMGGIEVRMNTPAGYRVDQDGDNLEELRSEIGPDDSASNVSYNRRGRGHRSKARRTPAPVEEEPEEGSSLAERVRRRY